MKYVVEFAFIIWCSNAALSRPAGYERRGIAQLYSGNWRVIGTG